MQRNRTAGLAAAAALALALGADARQTPPQAQQARPPVAGTHLKVGDVAPDFTLPDNNFKPVKLSDFRGKKNVVLAFYVLAFTGG
jgi:cytochrome oxidase Cu insertion factor (SCO1/SenC/PrrC family)